MAFGERHKGALWRLLCGGSVIAMGLSVPVMAQDNADDDDSGLEEITVTATRRAGSVQDVPINIAAVGGRQIEEQGFTELADLLPYVPGINVVDGGGRQGNPIIVRGLNAQALGSNDGNNTGGGTVATYIGEIPLFLDFKLNDLERVEVLLGPQGTLYGAGTLGGAIRYIPNKPNFEGFELQVRGESFVYAHAEDLSFDGGFTVNVPLHETLAFRMSADYVSESGFIDYINVVRQPGVSDPDPDFSDPADVAANLRTVEDADGERVLSGRAALRWMPTDWLDSTLTYYYQRSEVEGRRTSHARSLVPAGPYESAFRVEEPNEIENQLLALEVTADLGFAELTSATGFSKFADDGQRDQTTLLITLEYSYELFPNFTAFTREVGEEERFNQEVRLVSTYEGPFSWIIGGFYNNLEVVGSSSEFTPNYDTYAINVLGFDFLTDRPDDLEYFSQALTEIEERAVYGELSYEVFEGLTLTAGGRFYGYDVQGFSAVDFPLFDAAFVPSSLDQIRAQPFDPELAQSDDGFLFKFNASYAVNDDLLVYATVSEGYRIGGSNGIGQCETFNPDEPDTQGACALADGQRFGAGPDDISTRDERQFFADTTTNYEFGFKSTFLDGAATFNASFFYVDWVDPQLGSATVNANIPITVNADGASSKGVELFAAWQVNERLALRGNYSYIDSKLTAFAPALVRVFTPPGFGSGFEDGQDGDRLPGSPEHQFSLFASYEHPVSNDAVLRFNAGLQYTGEVLSRAGGRGSSLTLDDFATVDLSVRYETPTWSAAIFAENVFDAYAETGVVGTELNNQVVTDFDGEQVFVRGFRTLVLPPRAVGVRFTYNFMD